METDSVELEGFLTGLDGEIVSIIHNVRKTNIAQIYGVTRKIDFPPSSNGRSGQPSIDVRTPVMHLTVPR
jgi:hypothetical protein